MLTVIIPKPLKPNKMQEQMTSVEERGIQKEEIFWEGILGLGAEAAKDTEH